MVYKRIVIGDVILISASDKCFALKQGTDVIFLSLKEIREITQRTQME